MDMSISSIREITQIRLKIMNIDKLGRTLLIEKQIVIEWEILVYYFLKNLQIIPSEMIMLNPIKIKYIKNKIF
jgi:DNA polymerase III psi subunit